MADNSLALSPSELFSSLSAIAIPELARKPNDKFFVIPANKYHSLLEKAVDNAKIENGFKHYLTNLMNYVVGKVDADDLKQIYQAQKKVIDINSVQKYFGEVLGPLILIHDNSKIESIVFPVRTNYELFDYFAYLGKIYVGYSAKIEGGSSNTLSPKEIFERISKLKKKPSVREEKIGAEVISQFATAPMYEGIARGVGILVKNKIYPAGFTSDMKKMFDEIDFEKDAPLFEKNKTAGISKLNLSKKQFYKAYIDYNVLPKSRTIGENDKKNYVSGKKDYTVTNLIYSLGKFIVEANNDDKFDLSPLVKLVFQDLNVLKLGIDKSGIPSHKIITVSKSKDKYYLRSKHRWDVVKDKIGLQL
jgi:hypothetical protein